MSTYLPIGVQQRELHDRLRVRSRLVEESDDLDVSWAVAVALLLLTVGGLAMAGWFSLGRPFVIVLLAVVAVTVLAVGGLAVVAGRRTGEGPVRAFGRGCRQGVIWFVSLLP